MLYLPAADTKHQFMVQKKVSDPYIDYTEPLPLQKGQSFVLTGTDTYFGYDILFPEHNASA